MKFSITKYKGFTLAELMIILAVFAILLAAFAPIFTVRYKNASAEDVWAFVSNDENMDAYTNENSNLLTAQSFIGITPNSDADVLNAVSSTNLASGSLYSKVVIRSHDNLLGGEKQKQIKFKYGDSVQGTTVGGLFAGGGNMLLGGNYKNINPARIFGSSSNCSSKACYNTAFGIGALNSLTTGINNTALGFHALNSLTTGNDNTAIGHGSLESLTTGNRNTFVGTINEQATYKNDTSNNTMVGQRIGSFGNGNTFIGYKAGPLTGFINNINNNTAIGYMALNSGNIGEGNTAAGAYTFVKNDASALQLGNYNTALGYNACGNVHGSFKTCIGYKAGSSHNGSDARNFLSTTDTDERIFIGSAPKTSTVGGISVLEVHNLPRSTAHSLPRNNAGDSSVIINGNLVVRGQPYFTVAAGSVNAQGGPALVGFYVRQPRNGTNSRMLMGWDGRKRHMKVDQSCGGRCKQHAAGNTRSNCTCTARFSESSPANAGVLSYDWVSQSTNGNGGFADCQGAGNVAQNGKDYKDNSLNYTYSIDVQQNLNYAHRPPGYDSCCPDLRSDIRLKDVKGSFKGGLAELRQINIYNFTFKSDANKTPHVGVMAQDLKAIFPNAVTKDENGYYQIRWDEMLYAVINSIKTLNTKVEKLASRVSNNVQRIAVLKKDNAQLEQQVEKLSNELTLLERKAK